MLSPRFSCKLKGSLSVVACSVWANGGNSKPTSDQQMGCWYVRLLCSKHRQIRTIVLPRADQARPALFSGNTTLMYFCTCLGSASVRPMAASLAAAIPNLDKGLDTMAKTNPL